MKPKILLNISVKKIISATVKFLVYNKKYTLYRNTLTALQYVTCDIEDVKNMCNFKTCGEE